MQSIIDKQQNPSSFEQSVNELMMTLPRTGDPCNLAKLEVHLKNLSKIDPTTDLNSEIPLTFCANVLCSIREVVFGLVEFIQHHGKNKVQDSFNVHATRYKVCRKRLALNDVCV